MRSTRPEPGQWLADALISGCKVIPLKASCCLPFDALSIYPLALRIHCFHSTLRLLSLVFFAGATGSLVAPWVNWDIVKRKLKLHARREFIMYVCMYVYMYERNAVRENDNIYIPQVRKIIPTKPFPVAAFNPNDPVKRHNFSVR